MSQVVTAADAEVLLAQPRGFCAGVDRAIDIVERALDDVDGAIDAGTEAARLRQQDFGVGGGDDLAHQRTPNSATSTRNRTPASG